MSKIFLTGITGLVGSAFAVSLLQERNDMSIVALVRKSGGKTAEERVRSIIADQCEFDGVPGIEDTLMPRISVIEGDVADLDADKVATMPECRGVDVMFHCAADVNLGKDPTGKTFKINYNGTQNVLKLAKLLNVKELHYVGTAYIAGKLRGRAIEDNPIDSGFNNPYEESKYKAEMLVRASGIPFSIYRPAIIVGRRSDGKIRKPLAFYRILEFLAKLKSNYCAKAGLDPASAVDLGIHFRTGVSERIYFVPIDYVQETITALFQKPVCNKAYHITGDSPVTTNLIDHAVCEELNLKGLEVTADEVDGKDSQLMDRFIGDLYPYFSSDIIFDQSNVRAELGDKVLDWEFGDKGLKVMLKAFYREFFSNVEWLMKRIDADK